MSKNRVDGPTPRSVPARSRPLTGIFEALPAPAPKAAKTRPLTGIYEDAQVASGKALPGVAPRRARHVNQAPAARLAQLQVHNAPLSAPVSAPVRTDVATGQATPVSALRKAFDSLAPRGITADLRLLEGNNESWLSMWAALNRAQGDLDLSYFIFQRDIFGMSMLGQLYLAAKDGRQVRMMLDAAGDAFGKKGFTLSFRGQDYLQELTATGHAEVKVYHPLHKKALTALKSGDLRPFAGVANNHDKLLRTHDTVITGGRNISKDYFTDPSDRGDVYRDTDVMIRGREAAKAFKAAFEKEWGRDDILFKVYDDSAGNLARRDLEIVGAKIMMDAWINMAPASAAEKAALRGDEGARDKAVANLLGVVAANLPKHGIDREMSAWDRRNLTKMAEELVGYAELRGANRSYDATKEVHARQEVKVIDRTSAAVQSEDDLTAALSALASGARHRIIIQNPYVVLTKHAVAALEAAGKRGVHIDLLTNSPDSTDSLLTQAFFLEDWPRILARVPNMRIFTLTGEQKLHAKVATADDKVSVVGSYNLDLLSEQVNGEIAAASWSPGLARDIRKSFDADKANPAHKVVEYTIQRDEAGRPVLKDGKPVVTFGPNDHMSGWNKFKYGVMCWMVRQARKLPALKDISGIEL
ncbi:MAG: phosphatidylserine/phosphatidylglycerophosphate/cardiolipin synthase family protein [Deltaproteobacteria bacterium]|nr:phosphatidylserine/phosphatidylglycerophosphate/cardiolipin synthase family protein [Deltaproteobacteria bacterium]